MKIETIEQLTPGEIYRYVHQDGDKYYLKLDKIKGAAGNITAHAYMNVNSKSFNKYSNNFTAFTDGEWFEATADGREWFHKCEAAEKYIEMEQSKSQPIVLTDNDLNKTYFSCVWSGYQYGLCQLIKEGGFYYVVNNYRKNNDGHSDKTTYKYSLRYDSLGEVNEGINNIRIISPPSQKIPPSPPTSVKLYDEHLDSVFISCYYGSAFYDKAIVTKGKGDSLLVMNNCHSNYDEHPDKSVYRYSLIFTNWSSLNSELTEITILPEKPSQPKEYVTCTMGDGCRFIQGKKYEVFEKKSDSVYLKGENCYVSWYPLKGGIWQFKFGETTTQSILVEFQWYKLEASHLKKPWYFKFKSENSEEYKGYEYINGDSEEFRDGHCTFMKTFGYTLTLVDFKIIKPIKEKIEIEARLARAKKDYPIGTKYIDANTGNMGECVAIKEPVYIGKDWTCIEAGFGYVYHNGKWAEIVKQSEPPKKQSEFIEGDYVVCLPQANDNPQHVLSQKGGAGFEPNLCFKVSSVDDANDRFILWRVGGVGTYSNSVRRATPDEIAEYDRLNNSYDVTTLKDEFKEGDYIVTLKGEFTGSDCAKENYCFKIRNSGPGIRPSMDLDGSKFNGNTSMTFDKRQKLRDWRYATPDEITEYNRIGKPFDVTKIKTGEQYIVGRWYKNDPTKNDRLGGIYYAKFLKLRGKNVCSSEYIMDGRYTNSEYTFCIYPSWELMTDLSEIQEHLPSEHVDKIKVKPMNEAVYCKTQEEWDFACDKFGKGSSVKREFKTYNYNCFYEHNFAGWNTKEHFESETYYKIISFDEWCTRHGYTFKKPTIDEWSVGSYVVFTESYGSSKKGYIDIIVEPCDGGGIFQAKREGTANVRVTKWFATLSEAEKYAETIVTKVTYEVGDWILTSNNANGWGNGAKEVNNKILQITEIYSEDYGEYGGTYCFGAIKTVGREIVRKALSHEIPQSIPKYVKCAHNAGGWVVGKIYKCDDKQPDFPHKLSIRNNLGDVYHVCNWQYEQYPLNNSFTIATEAEYTKQQSSQLKTSLSNGNWCMYLDRVGRDHPVIKETGYGGDAASYYGKRNGQDRCDDNLNKYVPIITMEQFYQMYPQYDKKPQQHIDKVKISPDTSPLVKSMELDSEIQIDYSAFIDKPVDITSFKA